MNLVPKKWSTVLAGNDFVNIQTYSGRGLMGMDPNGANLFYPADASFSALGSALREALALSRWLSMDEYEAFFDQDSGCVAYEAWIDEMKLRFGYTSRKALFRGIASCTVIEDGAEIVIKPTVHEKLEVWSGTGHSGVDHVHIALKASDDELGQALRLAISRCR